MFVEGTQPTASGPSSASDEANELARVPTAELEREIGELAAHINAATCRWLLLAAEFERRGAHEAFGFVSCASWLAWRCSLGSRAAREQLRVARSLTELPLIRASFRRGRLSYSKVRALSRVAEPSMEEELLELAEEATASQLERLARGYRRAIAADADEIAQERRGLHTRWEDDGTLALRGSLPADEGALLLRALDLARDELRKEAEAGDDGADEVGRRLRSPSRADALVAIAESAIARGIEPAAGGERSQVVIHVDADVLASRESSASASVDGRVPIGSESARRIGCDASIVTLVERGGEPLSVGRRTRSVPPSIQRALRDRDGGCCFPGCERDRFVDAHHIEHWAHGGETSLDNLVQLCRLHHRLVHEGGFAVAREGRELVFKRPDGRRIRRSASQQEGESAGCVLASRASGAEVDPWTCFPGSAGEPMDLDLGVLALATTWERRQVALGA